MVFVDETWAETNMTPIRGWAPRAQKLVACAPFWPLAHADLLASLRYDNYLERGVV